MLKETIRVASLATSLLITVALTLIFPKLYLSASSLTAHLFFVFIYNALLFLVWIIALFTPVSKD
jgi:hypothetical protein